MNTQSFNHNNLFYPLIKYYKEEKIVVCDISVKFSVSEHTYAVLEQMVSQNAEVSIELNNDRTITLSAQMLDFSNSEYSWPDND
jgi:hypothetical protein